MPRSRPRYAPEGRTRLRRGQRECFIVGRQHETLRGYPIPGSEAGTTLDVHTSTRPPLEAKTQSVVDPDNTGLRRCCGWCVPGSAMPSPSASFGSLMNTSQRSNSSWGRGGGNAIHEEKRAGVLLSKRDPDEAQIHVEISLEPSNSKVSSTALVHVAASLSIVPSAASRSGNVPLKVPPADAGELNAGRDGAVGRGRRMNQLSLYWKISKVCG